MSNFSIGALNQLGDALENAGWTAADVTSLRQFKELGKIRDVLYGKALITYLGLGHIIDTDIAPFVPSGMSLESHIGHGLWKWAPDLIQLFLSERQKKNYQEGNQLRKVIEALKGRMALNANVLDYLLAHQELIPGSWKGKLVFFWGTIYRRSDGKLYVRYLHWDGSEWYWNDCWLGSYFRSDDPAVLASLTYDFVL